MQIETSDYLTPQRWVQQQFGGLSLGDQRRNARALALAAAMLRRPSASLPAHGASPAALKAADRVRASDAVSSTALVPPHWAQTRARARQAPVVLLVQDTTELDYSQHPTTTGLGPIGANLGRGLILHATLAVLPDPRIVLGRAAHAPFLRQPSPQPPGRGAATRRRRTRASQVWERAIHASGTPPATTAWVHGGDRAAASVDWMEAARAQDGQLLVRAAHDRRVQTAAATISHLLTVAHQLTPRDTRVLRLPARPTRPARQTQVAIAWQPVHLQPPAHSRKKAPLPSWLIRVWAPNPPADIEPVAWVLVTSVPTTTVAEAWERRAW